MKLRCVLITAALLVPANTFAEPARAPEESRAPVSRTAITAGSLIFLTSYGVSIGVGAQSLDRDDRGLYVPFAGPWIALHNREDQDRSDEVLLVIDGIAQATGALIVVGALIASTQPPPSDRARLAERRQLIRITPITTRGRPGIAFSGTF